MVCGSSRRFFAVFHCYLNFMAELTRYADREFYLDWWYAPKPSFTYEREYVRYVYCM